MPAGNVSNVSIVCTLLPYTVSGTVSGLVGGATVGLRLSDYPMGDFYTALAFFENGPFSFPTQLTQGHTWSVYVQTAPSGQSCRVYNAPGTINGANVENVQVVCGDPLVALYDLNEGAGTVIADSSGTDVGFDATVQSGTWVAGREGSGFRGWAVCDGELPSLTYQATVSMWINPTYVGGHRRIISMDSDWLELAAGNEGELLLFNMGNQISLNNDPSRDDNWATIASGVTAGEWHHVALAFDPWVYGGEIYVDGVLTWSGGIAPTPIPPFHFGARANAAAPGTEPFAGSYDHIRIYDRKLSPAEIQALASEF
jgi:hypothetical protein